MLKVFNKQPVFYIKILYNIHMSEDIKKILDYAIWAPSGDNSQPWRFEVEDNKIKVFNLPDKDNPYLNFRQSGSLIAHGGLLENITITAQHFGYEAEISLFPVSNDDILVAIVSLSKATNPQHDHLFQFIKQRHTNRRPYENTPLTPKQREDILRTPRELGFGKVQLVETGKEKQIVGRAGALAEIVILENKKLHEFLFCDVVWSEADEKKLRHGLYIKTMEFNSIQKVMFRLARNWLFMKLAIRPGLPKFIAKKDSKLYASGAAVGIVAMHGDSRENFVRAGRLMQRVWLKVTASGLALQPVTATLFFIQRILAGETENLLSLYHTDLMKVAYDDIKKTFGIQNETIAMMFRLGIAKPASARSSRISAEEKIIAIK